MRRSFALFVGLTSMSMAAGAADWLVDVRNDQTGVYAGTFNEEGAGIVQTCPDGAESTCYWNVVLDIACKSGDSYPALGNSASSASSLTLKCNGLTGSTTAKMYSYYVVEGKVFDSMVRESGIVGIAVSLRSGRFQVVRFDTSAAIPNLDRMVKMGIERDKKSTRSTKL